jgi:hypothetical protein
MRVPFGYEPFGAFDDMPRQLFVDNFALHIVFDEKGHRYPSPCKRLSIDELLSVTGEHLHKPGVQQPRVLGP